MMVGRPILRVELHIDSRVRRVSENGIFDVSEGKKNDHSKWKQSICDSVDAKEIFVGEYFLVL